MCCLVYQLLQHLMSYFISLSPNLPSHLGILPSNNNTFPFSFNKHLLTSYYVPAAGLNTCSGFMELRWLSFDYQKRQGTNHCQLSLRVGDSQSRKQTPSALGNLVFHSPGCWGMEFQTPSGQHFEDRRTRKGCNPTGHSLPPTFSFHLANCSPRTTERKMGTTCMTTFPREKLLATALLLAGSVPLSELSRPGGEGLCTLTQGLRYNCSSSSQSRFQCSE